MSTTDENIGNGRGERARSRHDRSSSPVRQESYNKSRERRDFRRNESSQASYSDERSDHERRYRDDQSRHPRRRDGSDHDDMYDDRGRSGYTAERDHNENRGRRQRSRDDSPRSSPERNRRRHRSRSPTHDAGRPSDTVILEGLPPRLTAYELHESLIQYSIAGELSTIDVRLSSTRGNHRAFIQFEHCDQAVIFVREHFPKVFLELPHTTDEVPDGRFTAYLHYARSRGEQNARNSHVPDWTCSSCAFSNYGTRSVCKVCGIHQSEAAAAWRQNLNGEADAADTPSQILVVYPLTPFTNEDMLALDMKKLEVEKPETSKDTSTGAKLKSTAPTADASGQGARPGSLHRVFIMRDAVNDESCKYGFAEYWTLEDALAALAKFRASRSFAVVGQPVSVSTIHMGVFSPEEREITPSNDRMSFSPLFNPNLRVRYRDLHAYPSQKIVTTELPKDILPKTNDDDGETGEDGRKSRKRKADGAALSGSVARKPALMVGQMAKWQRKHDELHTGSQATSDGDKPAIQTADDERSTSSDHANRGRSESGRKAPIKIAISKTTRLLEAQVSDLENSSPPKGVQAILTEDGANPTDSRDRSAQPSAVSYVDRDRLMCLICMRKYKSVDEVNIHEKSRNHKDAVGNADLVKAAQPRLLARDKRLQAQILNDKDSPSDAPQYRDRAKERREAYSQPQRSGEAARSKKTKADASNPSEAPEAQKPAAANSATSAPSKGAGMLAKMGWTAGAGLGATGDGRVDLIATDAYREGVGLGADGGNLGDAAELAEMKTKNSYAQYVNTVQDKARERYQKLG